ncbi:hypothetical protein [Paenirhodobacter enshiensis]|uniref:Lipoprotein n=1 Tax=Paenirhodobacter enshiensis TaxID=1105367 RepID=A0A086Y671_9RHOB|nr:hypothetical protein [Paenirhodobacter enshiensis]KFI29771.1 hypothetical protein CG50_09060 [Paenirhodobacter enshiensis]
MRALVLGLSLIGISGIVVSGCAGWAPQATPREATMKSGTLTVAFSDGTRCSADTLAARSGVLTGCAWPMSYDVTYYHPSLAAGTPLAPLFQDYATVRLSRAGAGGAVPVAGADAGQVWTFRTPADPHHDWEPDPKHDSGRGVSRGRD